MVTLTDKHNIYFFEAITVFINKIYIGETERPLKSRIQEHKRPSFINSVVSPETHLKILKNLYTLSTSMASRFLTGSTTGSLEETGAGFSRHIFGTTQPRNTSRDLAVYTSRDVLFDLMSASLEFESKA